MAANPSATPGTAETLVHAPADLVADVGEKSRSLLQEVGSMFWFIINTIGEFDRMPRPGVSGSKLSLHRAGRGRFRTLMRDGLVFLPTMALLTGYQLERFGTERLVPGLVAIAFTRELGPLLTGIMLAARIGASFTAELGTMQVSEEVEAIEAMGIGPLRFLVAPRMLALFALMPCLSVVSSLAAIFATALISRAYFNIAFVYFQPRPAQPADARHHHGHREEFHVWVAHWGNRLLPRAHSEGRRGWCRHRDHFQRRHRDHGRDWFRYAF
jgi:ABC-type transporter Mla maintaining outer membrane lipid asymmetry permease subunit MlaE